MAAPVVQVPFGHLVADQFIVFEAVPPNVYSLVDRVPHGVRIGYSGPGLLECRPMVGRRTYYGQAGGEIHTVFEGNGLERSESLVVVHCQYGIETGLIPKAEETVGGIGAECVDPLSACLLDGRGDDFGFFASDQAAVTAVWIEAEDRDLR